MVYRGSFDQRNMRGLVPYCGQDGYQAQHPIDSYINIILQDKSFFFVRDKS